MPSFKIEILLPAWLQQSTVLCLCGMNYKRPYAIAVVNLLFIYLFICRPHRQLLFFLIAHVLLHIHTNVLLNSFIPSVSVLFTATPCGTGKQAGQ